MTTAGDMYSRLCLDEACVSLSRAPESYRTLIGVSFTKRRYDDIAALPTAMLSTL